jgi:hypothetical protein
MTSSNTRKLLLFIIAIAMLGGGLYLVGGQLLTANGILGRFVAGGALLVLFGGYLLWVDFIAPALGIKTWEG